MYMYILNCFIFHVLAVDRMSTATLGDAREVSDSHVHVLAGVVQDKGQRR